MFDLLKQDNTTNRPKTYTMNSQMNLNIEGFPKNFYWHNDQFPPLDALTYWHFLKGAKRVIEIGCGYSTYLSYISGVELTAIDPQPRLTYDGVSYILKPVQEVDPSIFDNLEENDILFVDSSHIYSEGSDVQYLIDVIIPKLKKGVYIQFHDYFRPFDYPESWKQHPEMSKWNEQEYVFQLEKKLEVIFLNYLYCQTNNGLLLDKYHFVPRDIHSNLGAVRGASVWFKS
jgi:hypothetical protein